MLPASMVMNDAVIGVFDSGVGGLSVLREVRKALPAENLLYVADSGFAPYGDRPAQYIQDRTEAIVGYFAGAGAKAAVIACNTATAVAVHALRARFSFPIVAIEPAVKPAVEITRSGIIGILATKQTLASDNFSRLVEKYGHNVRVLAQPCPGLVEQVEKGELDGPSTRPLVTRYVAPLIAQGADTLVLGCTHFPFLRATITDIAGTGVFILDPAIAVARELHRRLKACDLLSSDERPGTDQFRTSGEPETVQPVFRKLWAANIEVRPLP